MGWGFTRNAHSKCPDSRTAINVSCNHDVEGNQTKVVGSNKEPRKWTGWFSIIRGPTNFMRNQLFRIINNPIVGLPSLRNTQTISISFVILCIFATFFHCVSVTFWLEPNWPSCSARAVSKSFFSASPPEAGEQRVVSVASFELLGWRIKNPVVERTFLMLWGELHFLGGATWFHHVKPLLFEGHTP